MSDGKENGSNEAGLFKAFGLTISSCLHFPELLPGAGTPDVTVVYDELPGKLPDAAKKGVDYQSKPGEVLIDLDKIARFLVRNGSEIRVQRHVEATDDDVRLFLLGWAFAALMQQRGMLTLHASSVKVDDGCVVFLGNCGMGKSTLATELVRRGYPSLGDDVCAISIDKDGVAYAAPAFPMARLKLDSLEQFGIDPAGLRRIRPSREKRCLPLERFACEDRLPVKRLYVLSYPTHNPELTVKPMTGPPKIRVLRDNTYRVQFLPGLNQTHHHFKQIAHLASRIPLLRVFRQQKGFDVEKLARVVEDDFLSCNR